jgi:hypothetical protein
MALIPAPGVAQLRLVGTIGLENMAQVLHFYAGTGVAWTQGQINTLATSAFQHLAPGLLNSFGTNVSYHYAEALDLTDATERVARTTAPALPGTAGSPFSPNSSSIMVSHHIASRYRGGHPRTYFPPANATNGADGDTWTDSLVSSFQTAYNNWRDQIITDLIAAGMTGPVQCSPRYTYRYDADPNKHKFLKTKTGYVGPFPISQSIVSKQQRSQRRRLGAS